MKKQQSGFTLIELVVVIVILGILAAVAIPKFVDLKSDAQAAAFQGVRGSIESASAINYAANSANSRKGVTTGNLTCNAAAGALLLGGLPTGYTLTGDASATAGTVNACVLVLSGYTAATGVNTTANIISVTVTTP